jgi:hypothetical protein
MQSQICTRPAAQIGALTDDFRTMNPEAEPKTGEPQSQRMINEHQYKAFPPKDFFLPTH